MRLALAIVFALIALPVAAAQLYVVDGDTFRIDGATVRIENIDAPELRSKCDAERRLGRVAAERLKGLLASGAITLSRNPEDPRNADRNGRLLRRVAVDGVDAGDVLVAEGLARPWTGKRQPWC